MHRPLSALALPLLIASIVHAENWDRFRGPDGKGEAVNQNLPDKFDGKILWKVPVPGLGTSSPVIWGEHILLASSSEKGDERSLICLNRKDGSTAWVKKFPGVFSKTHAKNTMASSTPSTDGKAIYSAIWDGKAVALYAHDFKGKELWKLPLAPWTSQHGPGGSPILLDGKLYYLYDMDGKSTLYAVDPKSGQVVWENSREAHRACYSAPILSRGPGGKPEIIICSTTAIQSYAPENGDVNWSWNWTFTKMALRTITTPMEIDGKLVACSGDGSGERNAVGLDLKGLGKGAKVTQMWENKKDFPYVPNLLQKDKLIYFVADKGYAGCYDLKGERLWYERIPEAYFTASPILVDGKMIAASEEGDVYVFNASPKFREPVVNRLGEMIRATPAVADGRLYIRGMKNLYCIGNK